MRSSARERRAFSPARRLNGLIAYLAACLFAALLPVAAIAQDAETPAPPLEAGAPSFGECERAVDEAALRAEVFDGAREVMRRAALDVDYSEIVLRSWIAARFDQKFERIVDAKIAVLRADRAYFERLLDGNVPSRAKAMAEQTADLVFNSPEFEALSQDLQAEIGKRLEPVLAGADLATQSRASECVRTFLGARYAATVRDAFTADAGSLRPRAQVQSGDVGLSAAFNLAGVVAAMLTVVFRRLVRRIVRTVVRRLAGAIAARMAAWLSVIAGVAVLVWELFAGADGVFPIIREELVSAETKQTIQTGLIEELAAAGPEELDKRALEIAALMFERWRSFKQNHRAVLALAESEPRFKAFLAEQPPERFEALSVIVRRLKQEGGDAAVLDALDRGILSEALRIETIAADLELWVPRGLTLADLVAWRRSAGDLYGDALAARLPEVVAPGDLEPAALEKILALGPTAARTVAALPAATRAVAMTAPQDLLAAVAARHGAEELDNLFGALAPLPDPERRDLYLTRAVADPAASATLAQSGVAGAVSASRNPEAALDMLLSRGARWNPFAMIDDVTQVADGEIAPMTLPLRYGWGLAAGLGLPLLVAIGLLRSLLGMVGLRRRR